MKHQNIDWSRPQRQPTGGLLIAFSKILWEVIKKGWWLLLVILLKDKPEEASGISRYEIIALAIVALTFAGTLLQHFYFRFYIAHHELVIKKGWLKKQTLVVPLAKIQTVHIEASLLHQVLNLVKVSVDTAGSDKTEVEIDALRRPMAEALQLQLQGNNATDAIPITEKPRPILQLSAIDLLKLSISANHLETLALLISFGAGLYDNLKDIDNTFLPNTSNIGFSGMMLLFLIAAVLFATIIISTLRICLRFYGLTVFETGGGLAIRSGLTNVKEQVVVARKVQAITWKANWIRKRMGLWLVEFRVTGNDELRKKQKVQVPVTQADALPFVINTYYPMPEAAGEAVHIHPSYTGRKLLMTGIIPSIFLILTTYHWIESNAFFFLFIPLLVGLHAALFQKRFRLYAFTDVLFIDKSTWGLEKVLIQWYKVQSVELKQSLFQRKRGLANVTFYTAGGSFRVPFIDLAAARCLVNYAVYKIEDSTKKWM